MRTAGIGLFADCVPDRNGYCPAECWSCGDGGSIGGGGGGGYVRLRGTYYPDPLDDLSNLDNPPLTFFPIVPPSEISAAAAAADSGLSTLAAIAAGAIVFLFA